MAIPVRAGTAAVRRRDPKPLWISGTVQSLVSSQLPMAGVAACWVEKIPCQADPASAASLQSPKERGKERPTETRAVGG